MVEMPNLKNAKLPKVKWVDEFKTFALKGNVNEIRELLKNKF